MRQSFTYFWNGLGSNTKSVIISIWALAIATTTLRIAINIFPHHDFTLTTAMVVTAFSGFIAHLIKSTCNTRTANRLDFLSMRF